QPLGIGDTVAGGTVDPAGLVDGLARAAVAAGATLHEGAAVDAITAGPPATLTIGASRVVADHVVLAMNAYTPALVPAGPDFTPRVTLGLCTAPLPPEVHAAIGLGAGLPFYTSDLPYLWGRPTRDGRLILGAGLVSMPARDAEVL